jgi:hypothetical protein
MSDDWLDPWRKFHWGIVYYAIAFCVGVALGFARAWTA